MKITDVPALRVLVEYTARETPSLPNVGDHAKLVRRAFQFIVEGGKEAVTGPAFDDARIA